MNVGLYDGTGSTTRGRCTCGRDLLHRPMIGATPMLCFGCERAWVVENGEFFSFEPSTDEQRMALEAGRNIIRRTKFKLGGMKGGTA